MVDGVFAKLEATLFSRAQVGRLSAVVAGAGALGNEVLRQLGLIGLADVTVVDPDRVEPANLPRSFLFRAGDSIGRNKAVAATAAASDLFPATRWAARDIEIADVGSETLAKADLVFSCLDSELARFELAYLAKRADVLVVDGGLGRDDPSFGRVSLFPPGADMACFGCLLGPRKRRTLLETWHSTIGSCTMPADVASSPSTPTMAAVVGAMQTEIGIRGLIDFRHGALAASRSVEIRLHPGFRITEFTTEVSTTCPFHEGHEGDTLAVSDAGAAFEDLLAAAGAEALRLDWPLCVEARCQSCGHVWEPRQRLATLRRRGRCPLCGSPSLLEVGVLRSIARGSSWAQLTPAALRLPVDHRYELRRHDARHETP